MRKFSALFKAQFLSFLSGLGKNKSKKSSALGKGLKIILPLLLGALIFGCSYLYTYIFFDVLSVIGKTGELLPIMLSLSVVVSLIFSFYSAIKVLFGFNDYDMFFSMPIKTHVVVLSKLAFSYVVDLIFSILIVMPCLIFQGKFGINLNALNLLNVIIMLLGAPFFSICISTVLGLIIAFVSARAKRKTLLETLFFLVILVGYFALLFLTASDEQAGEETMFLFLGIKTYFVYPLVVLGVNSTPMALLVFGVQAVAVSIPILFVCVFYKTIHNFFVAKKTSKRYNHKTQKSTSRIKALYKKEIKRLFSSSLYVMNSLIGVVIGFIGVIVLSVVFIKNGLNTIAGLGETIIVFVPAVLGFVTFMAPPTNCSISLEGKSFWVLRTAPVSMKTVFNSKLLATLTFYLPVGVVASVLVPIALGVNLLTGVLFALIAITIPVLSANFGLLFNLLFPMLNWDNENKPIKQGASILVTMLAGMGFSALLGVGAYFLTIKAELLLGLMLVVSLALTLITYFVITNKGQAILERKA